jgi:hypothetical protein
MMKSYLNNLSKVRFIIVLSLLLSNLILPAQTTPSRDYQIKAIFLFNFTQYVNWLPGSFSSSQAPIVIGVLGTDPFGSYLEEAVAGEKINGRSLIIQRYNNIDEIGTCHILFINLSDAKKTAEAITKLSGRNILTVSDAPDFLEQGGMVRFYTKQDKIKLQVNLEAVKAANLVISSKLLRLVEIFTSQKNN